MGLLLHARSGRLHTLVPHSLVGRGPTCPVRLDDPRASAEHAVIAWDGAAWEARDLGSMNGTFVDGQRLARGGRVALRRDSRLGFGVASDVWILADDRPADARLDAPTGTLKTGAGPIYIEELALGFVVSADEEHVDVQVRVRDGEAVQLPPRSCQYTVLTLARARLADAERGVPAAEQGWVYAAELADMLGYTPERVNVEIYRARALLGSLGVVDAAGLIERRTSSRQLRIGVASLTVARAAEAAS